jgi:hypothetical protein
VARGHAARRRGVTAPTPIYEATAHDQGLDPATWAVLIRADIVKAREHTDGQPWPEWDAGAET